MRLHHLSVTAFGPFAGTEEIDFDELSDAGLFLLTGPTGAGKTTILDAVCFALYGTVPGVRGVKALKSQHAPDDVRPEVVLDFSVRDRRFVLRRSPEWTRPKRRGEGLTTQNAAATLLETTTGEERLLSSRAQEVGHFIGELVGMQASQFVQVAMLPQGEFQTFLRASSQDRHAVLQQLFRTDRYSRIEEWVHDHSRRLKERSDTGEQAVCRVLATIADRAGGELPERLGGQALQADDVAEQARAWVGGLMGVADEALVAATDRRAAAEVAAREARAALEEARRTAELHRRRERAQASLAELAGSACEAEQAQALLDADVRAARCLPLLAMLDDASARLQEAELDRELAGRRLQTLFTDLSPDQPSADQLSADQLSAEDLEDLQALERLEQRARAAVVRLEALLPRERELSDVTAKEAQAQARLSDVTEQHAEVAERAAVLPGVVERHRSAAAAAARLAAPAESIAVELGQAERRLASARDAETCAESLPSLRDAKRAARERTLDARELVQQLTARRLAGIAAELAGQLADGRPCQVCGSSDHPAPATPSDEVVTEAEQAEALAAQDAATAIHLEASGALSKAEERLEGLRSAAGGLDTTAATARVEDLTGRLRAAEAARAEQTEAEAALELLAHEQQGLATTLGELAVQMATARQTVEEHERSAVALRAELASEVRDGGSLAVEIEQQSAYAAELAVARAALIQRDAVSTRVADLTERTEVAAREHGFPDLSLMRLAALPSPERVSLEALLASRREAAARAEAVLEDDDVRGIEGQDVPDVDALAGVMTEREETLASSARTLHQCEETAEALRRLRDRLDTELEGWAPTREEYLRADSMAKLVRGMSSDNQLQMRLSAYVLATRLDQVVAAANERLAHMRDQRYLLQRTGQASRKGAQAGLGLEVVDQWTGDVRAPTTLSGGETFVVSLALALGLADVVTQEAGGTEVETLFVDEGFGTLDAGTLDDVMDRLDDLRAGGRAVGVVSHVSELRNRIPMQLHVEKGRNGSAVAVRTAVG